MATLGQRYYTPNQFEIDRNGVPLAGAQLFFFATGTTTPQATYADVNLSTPNANPVIADANGRFGSIFLSPVNGYAVQLWTAPTVANPTGSQVWSEDPVGPGAGGVPTSTAGIVGEVRAFAAPAASIPAGWYACFGQAVSRTTYSVLFAAIGTTWGAGDGTTTFNLPDLRGRGLFGLDNMGGTPANRITAGVSGITGTTLGASGGDQNVQQHTHSVNDPQHTHSLTDPGHSHTVQVASASSGGSTPGLDATSAAPSIAHEALSDSAMTGITISDAATGITINNFGTGTAANVPPGAMVNLIIYAGV